MKTNLLRFGPFRSCIGVLAVLCIQIISVNANILSWSGTGSSGNWSDSGNWGAVGTPANGDSLVFVSGQPRPLNTNNISNLTLNQIRFVGAGGGYIINGNAFTLTNSIQATNTPGLNIISNNIAFATADITVIVSNSLTLGGALSGPVGLTKSGAGTLTYSGGAPNTYSGTTRVFNGTLTLNRDGVDDAVVGPLIVGDFTNSATVLFSQALELGITIPVTVNRFGTLNLNDGNDTIGSLEMGGGAVTTGSGTLSLINGSTFYVSTNISSTISGNFNIGNTSCIWTQAPSAFIVVSASISGSASIIDNGLGQVYLNGSNSFTGPITLTGGIIEAGNSWALGSTNSGTTVNETATLAVTAGANIPGELLSLNSSLGWSSYGGLYSYGGISNSWLGVITLGADVTVGADTGSTLNILSPINGGAFGVTKTFPGTVSYSGTNANGYTGKTTVNAGTLVLNKSVLNSTINGNLAISGTLRLNNFEQIADTADVLVNGGGTFDLGAQSETIDTLHGTGNVTFSTFGFLIVGANGGSSTFDGLISGVGFPGGYTVRKTGFGTFTLTANNTYQNGTEVTGGKLNINGSQPQSPVIFVASGTTLGGSGVVGDIVGSVSGSIAPGNSPGILTSSNVVFGAGSSFVVELNGASSGVGNDQLNVRGTNSLAAATLFVSSGGGFAPSEGSPIAIINNDGFDPIVGTFAGLPEGSVVNVGALKLRISYLGGDGNDVTLTLTNPPLQAIAGSVTAGNGDSNIDPGECNSLFLTITNTTVTPLTGVSATLSSMTPGAVVPLFRVSYPDVPVGGKATNSQPFQLTTQPWFVAGTNISLLLSVTSSVGSFSTLFTLPTGGIGSAVRSNNTTPMAIPDLSTNDSFIFVSGITSAVAQVTVSMNISHTFDADLDIYLIAPDGTPIELTTDNGGSGQNYGSSCTDGSRTVFDDSALTPITAGSAPFVGTYRPEGQLSKLRGLNPNGVWTLRVIDDQGGDVGTLNCWSLFISPTTSTNGGGVCDLCPNVTLSSGIGLGNPAQSDRLSRNGTASSCGFPTLCPGGLGFDSPYFDAFTFQNGPSNACINVTLISSLADVFSATYLGGYDSNNLCNNYLADSGDSTLDTGGTVSYSFTVASNAVFVVEINSIFGSAGPYQLAVTGGDCRPVLNISPAGTNVLVNWTTAASGYQLEQTNSLPAGTNWSPVPNLPAIVGGKYQVTNGVPGTSNQFYRLRKALP